MNALTQRDLTVLNAVAEAEELARRAIPEAGFVITGVEIDALGGPSITATMRPAVEPKDADLAAAIVRMIAVRYRYADAQGLPQPSDPEWWRELVERDYWSASCAVRDGWSWLVIALAEQLDELTVEHLCVADVKQKYGQLRVEWSGLLGPDYEAAHRSVAAYEVLAEYVCETCGAPAEVRDHGGWLTALCDEHASQQREPAAAPEVGAPVDRIQERALNDFTVICHTLLGDDAMYQMRFSAYGKPLGGVTIDVISSPRGPRRDEEHPYSVDRALVVEAARRYVEYRARWRYRADGTTVPVTDAWRAQLQNRRPWFPPRFECRDGWGDLLLAMTAWLEELGVPEAFRFSQIKEKFAGLRAYTGGMDLEDRVDQAISAVCVLSSAVCETCGAPGHHRKRGGWHYLACDEHARD